MGIIKDNSTLIYKNGFEDDDHAVPNTVSIWDPRKQEDKETPMRAY